MQTPFDTLFEQVQPDATEILAAPFLISDRISKRALTFRRPFPAVLLFWEDGFFRFLRTLVEGLAFLECTQEIIDTRGAGVERLSDCHAAHTQSVVFCNDVFVV